MSLFGAHQVIDALKYEAKRQGSVYSAWGYKLKKMAVQLSFVRGTPKYYVLMADHHDSEIWIEKTDKRFNVAVDGRDAVVNGKVIDLKNRKMLP